MTFGARRPPKGGPETSKREPQTTQTVSLECLWAAFWGRGPQGDNPGDPKGASRRRGAQVLEKYQKTMSISFRRNVHAVEARSLILIKRGCLRAGRPPKLGPKTSKRQPETTQTASLECLSGGRASRGGAGSFKETTQATQKRPPAAEARRF